MSDEMVVILSRTGLTVLLICVAVLTVALGYKLFKSGAGVGPSHIIFKCHGFEAKATSVGSVVMLTACVWAWPITHAIPTYERSSDDGTVSVSGAGYTLETTKLISRPAIPIASAMSDPKALQGLFHKAIEAHKSNPNSVLQLNGKAAYYDTDSIEVKANGRGTYLLKADIKSEAATGTAYYAVEPWSGKIVFRPQQVAGISSRDDEHDKPRLPDEGSNPPAPRPLPSPGTDGQREAPTLSPLPFKQ